MQKRGTQVGKNIIATSFNAKTQGNKSNNKDKNK
jgi:hypothetical protein